MSTNELTEKELDEIQQKIAAKNAPESAEAFKITIEKLEELIRADLEKKYTAKLEGEAQKLADKKITELTKNSLLARQQKMDEAILVVFEVQSEIIKTLKEQAERLTNQLKIIELGNQETKALRETIEKALREANKFTV